MKKFLGFFFFAAASVAIAQNYLPNQGAAAGGDVLTTHDGRGNIATIYNIFDGRNSYIKINRLSPQGYVAYEFDHQTYNNQKAYAAIMDEGSNVFITGEQRRNGRRSMVALRYDKRNYMSWEAVDDRWNCSASMALLDTEGYLLVAGMCTGNGGSSVRVVKYDPERGGQYWAQEYESEGRSYLRGARFDLRNNLALDIEVVFGDFRSGNYVRRTVVFDTNGTIIEILDQP